MTLLSCEMTLPRGFIICLEEKQIPRPSFLQSTAEFCVDQGQRLRQWPQFTHSPWDVLLSQARLPSHLMPGLLPAHRGSAFEVGNLHFQGRMSEMQTHGQLCCGGQTSVAGSAPGSAALLHQGLTCYLREQICFCTMFVFVVVLLSHHFQLPGFLFFPDMGTLRPVYSHRDWEGRCSAHCNAAHAPDMWSRKFYVKSTTRALRHHTLTMSITQPDYFLTDYWHP